MANIQRVEQIVGHFSSLCIALSRQHGEQGDVVGHIEERDQLGCLQNEADLVAAERAQRAHLPAIVVNELVADRHLA